MDEEKQDDELEFDFSKIKDWFRKVTAKAKSAEPQEAPEEPDEISFDYRKVWSWVYSNSTLVVLCLLLLLQFMPNNVFGFTGPWGGVWARMQAEDVPVTEGWADNAVTNYYQNILRAQINQEYPNLPDSRKQELVQEKWLETQEEQASVIEQQKEQTRKQLLSHWQYEDSGHTYTYMPDIDPYYYLRFSRNLVEEGQFADKYVDGRAVDTHMFAPETVTAPDHHLHPYVLAGIYSLMSIFSTVTLMQAAGYFPIFAMVLAFIFAFLAGRKFGGNVAGAFAATLLILIPTVAGRTLFGHADTDAYNLLFPMLAAWIFMSALESKGWKLAGWCAGLVATLYFYELAWNAWYIVDFMLVGLGAFVGMCIWKHRSQVFGHMNKLWPVAVISASLLFSLLLSGTLLNTIRSALSFMKIKEAAHHTLWPNVYTTVAELNPGSIDAAINSLGTYIFWACLIGIALLAWHSRKREHYLVYAGFLAAWFIGTTYATTKGIRFAMMLAPGAALAFGAFVGLGSQCLAPLARKHLGIASKWSKVAVALLGVLLLVYPSNLAGASVSTARQDVPLVNDAWWNALTEIKENSEEDAIITSWWDFGHHFKYIADRPVNFDGASQNSPKAHWVGKLLLTGSEDEAVGILRMLDCGGNRAYEALNSELPSFTSIRTINDIIVMNRSAAEAHLSSLGLPDVQVKNVTGFTHCEPPEGFVIASHDMIGKAGVWSHFGSWDFRKAEAWIRWRKLPKSEAVPEMMDLYNMSEEDAEDLYTEARQLMDEDAANRWIAPWPSFLSEVSSCREDNGSLVCDSGLSVKGINGTISTNAGKQDVRVARITRSGEFLASPEGPEIGALVWPEAGGWKSVMVQTPLETSMFLRLFFVNGHGLEHFTLLTEQTQLVQNGKIFVWQVDWEGHEPNVLPSAKVREVAEDGAIVTLDYVGWLEEGDVFDSSVKSWASKNVTKDVDFASHDTTPLKVTLGGGELLPRFEHEILGLRVNESKTFNVSPSEGYVDPAHPLFNRTLTFRVHVSDID